MTATMKPAVESGMELHRVRVRDIRVGEVHLRNGPVVKVAIFADHADVHFDGGLVWGTDPEAYTDVWRPPEPDPLVTLEARVAALERAHRDVKPETWMPKDWAAGGINEGEAVLSAGGVRAVGGAAATQPEAPEPDPNAISPLCRPKGGSLPFRYFLNRSRPGEQESKAAFQCPNGSVEVWLDVGGPDGCWVNAPNWCVADALLLRLYPPRGGA